MIFGWLVQRARDILPGGKGEGDAYPKERLLCIVSFLIRTTFMVCPVLVMFMFLPIWFPLKICASYVGAVIGAFVYADLGPEEWFRKLTLGRSDDPTIWPLGTLEGYCGAISRKPVTWNGQTKSSLEWWQELKSHRLAPWWGDPGNGTFS